MGRVGRAVKLAGEATAAAAVAIGYESVKMATSFQASMERVRTQAGASQKDVALLSQEVLKLGQYAQQSPQELADSLFHLKSVGLDNAKAMRALRTASDLAAVGGANLEDVTNALAGAWRSGVKGARDFGKEAGLLNAIVGAGNMRMQDLAGAMGTGFLSTANTFGLSLKSVGAALALMTDEGTPAQQAAYRLRMAISLMAAPSDKAAGELNSIGLGTLSLGKAMRGPQGLIGAISLLKDHLDKSGLSATEASALLSHAFGGGRSSSAILLMIKQLETLRRKQAQINGTTSRFGADVVAQRKTAQAQFALLRSSLDVLAVKIGSALLPPLTGFVRFINMAALPAVVGFGKTVAAGFESIIPVKAIEADWHKLLRFLGVEKPKVPKLTTADLIHLPKPLGLSTADLIHLPPEKAALPMSVDLLHPLPGSKAASGVATSMASSIGAALEKVNWGKVLGGLPAKLVGAVGAVLGKVNWVTAGEKGGGWILEFILGLADSLLNPVTWFQVFKKAWPQILGLLATVITLPFGGEGGTLLKPLADLVERIPFLKVFAPLLRWADRLLNPLKQSFQRLWHYVFGPVERIIGGFFTGAKNWLLGKGDDITVGLLSGVERRFPKLANWLAGMPGRISRFFAAATGWLVSKGADVISGLWHGLQNKWPAAAGFLKSIPGKIGGFFTGAIHWLLTEGGDVILGLLRGIRAKMSGIAGWVKSVIVDPVISAVKHYFGIHSPSTVMAGIGAHLVGGLMKGMVAQDPTALVTRIFMGLPQALGALVKKGLVSISSLPRKALRALGGLGGKALGWLEHLFGGGGGGGGGANASVARSLFPWPASMWPAFNYVEMREAGYNLAARNPSSGAYGVAQFINGPSEYYQWGGNPNSAAGQFIAMFNYIRSRYGNPVAAAAHEQAFNWYAKGTRGARPGWAWVGERGPELVRMLGGETVLDAVTSRHAGGYAKGTGKLDREQRVGLSVAEAFLRGTLSTVASIRHAAEAAVKAVKEFYKGSQRRWRIRDIQRITDRMEAKARRLAEVRSQIAAAKAYAKTVTGNLRGYAGLSNVALPTTNMVNFRPVTTGRNIAAGLRQKLATLRRFGAMIGELSRKGLDRSLLRQIIDMGPDDGLAYGKAILSGNYIRQLNATERQIARATRQIGRHAADDVYDRGRRAGKGFLTGLKAERRELDAEMKRLGDVLGRETARWFHVPRRELPHHRRHHHHRHHRVHHRAMGGWITEPVIGYGQDTGDEWRFGEGGRRELVTAGGGGDVHHHLEVRVFVGDREITDIVRTEIREDHRDTVRRTRAGTGRRH